MKKAMAVAMALAAITLGSEMASAQESAVVSISGLNLQVGVANVKDDLLAGTEKFAQGASKVTEINLNPQTMGMAGRTYGPEGDLTKKMKLMVVHSYTYEKPGMYRMDDVEGYVKKLEDGSWSCPVVSREKDRFSYICAKTDSDQTNEMVILSAEPQQLTFIHMAGTMSFNALSSMGGSARSVERSVGHNSDSHRAIIVAPMPAMPPTPPAPPATTH